MQPGKLRHRITFERYNESAKAWEVATDIGTNGKLWADVNIVTSDENLDPEDANVKSTATALIRQQSGITGKMRFIFTGRYFYIEGKLEDRTTKRHITINAAEIEQ